MAKKLSELRKKLSSATRESFRRDWMERNHGAVEDYNRRIQKRGAFSDGLRRF